MTSIPTTGLACVFEGADRDIKIDEKSPVPQPSELKAGEVLVKVEYSGVCHTDLHIWKGDTPFPVPFPRIGGHEGAGTIVALGDGTDSPLRVGQAVGIKWISDTCHSCAYCHSGHDQHCAQGKVSGLTEDGTFRQYMIAAARYVTPIPDGMPLEYAAPVLCAGVTTWRALKRSNAKPGEWVAISGAAGGLGHLAVQYALATGLRVVAIDGGADKRKLCEEYGVDAFVDFRDYKSAGELVDKVKAICDGVGPHAALVCATGGGAYAQALEFLRPCGTLVAVALAANTKIEAEVFSFIGKGLTIAGSYVGSRTDAMEALDFVARGKVKPEISVEPLRNVQSVLKCQ
ncbi:Alcohol dehydrogenase [Rhodotorula kratochvilovae]